MNYRVTPGDCMASIGRRFGIPWRTLWDHPANAELQRRRRNPNVLAPGDVVVIPQEPRRQEDAGTGARHRFRARRELVVFSVQIRRGGQPRANVPFRLEVGGRTQEGTTDAQGWIRARIPADAEHGTLTIDGRSREIALGHLDPVETPNGIAQRLRNLGLTGPSALALFQRKHGLPVTGEPDERTRQALAGAHGS